MDDAEYFSNDALSIRKRWHFRPLNGQMEKQKVENEFARLLQECLAET